MSGFSVDWLQMREPYDHAARSAALVDGLALALPGDRPVKLLELAVGYGSGPRFVAPRLKVAQSWTVVDHDPALLAALESTLDDGPLALHTVQTRQLDLRDLGVLDIEADAVLTQALIDLVSREWLVNLADWITTRRIPFLAALTVDGRITWDPIDDRDAEVHAAFRAHQLGDRGFGVSPGHRAAPVMAGLLTTRGYQVTLERADWRIPASASDMLEAMARGIAHAATEAAVAGGTNPQQVAAWLDGKIAAVGAGSVSLEVGHLDLLAVP